MSARTPPGPCPEPDMLAAFAEGKLPRRDIPALYAHIDGCPRCMAAIEGTNAEIGAQPASRVPWLAVAAAVAVALLSIPIVRMILDRRAESPAARLVSLAPRSARIVEPRLSGGFPWAPYEGPLRAGDPAADTRRLKLDGAAGEIIDEAEHSPSAQHAAGIALVLIERPLDAAARLHAAAERTPADARVWSDLAAAQYSAAARLDRPSLYPEALVSADHALRIDPRFAEALFNRALILERLGTTGAARAAWEHYLRTDPSSPWAVEARERRQRLPPTTSELQFRRDLPRLEQSAIAGDQTAIDALVDRYPQQSRAYAEAEHLGRWAEAMQAGDAKAADRNLAIARRVGDALVRRSGETLLRDAVRAIDAADAARRNVLAAAHVDYRRGRIAYSRQQPAAAESDLRRAASEFASTPMALAARYFAANTRFDQNDVAGARRELEALVAEVDARPGFQALGAQVRWELSLCHIVNDDWVGALPYVRQARAAFDRLGERSNHGTMETMLADTLAFLGRPDEAWAARIRALRIAGDEGRGDRLPVALGEAARMELRAGRLGEARALLQLQDSAVRALSNDVLLADTLAVEAVLNARLGDAAAAAANVHENFAAARRVADPAMRDKALADASFAAGASALPSEPGRADELLTSAIGHFRASGKSFFLPEAFLLRARAREKRGDAAAALADLDNGIAEIERHRSPLAGAVVGTGVLDAGIALYADAIRMRLDRGGIAGAFAYAERSRGRLALDDAAPVTVAELQRRLAGTGTAVLELVALPGEIVAFCITGNDATAERRRARPLPMLDETALYDLLIRPSEQALAGARQLIVVADASLEEIPFAALYDSRHKQYLIERMPIRLAPSASALRGAAYGMPHSIAALVLPTATAPALPATRAEIEAIGALYRRRIATDRATIAALQDAASRADVIHIAGHTERQPGLGDSALLFASNDGTRAEPLSWRGIAGRRLGQTEVVVLAACETLRAPRSAQARATSIGGGFLAAGVPDVIGTLTPLADEQARSIFSAVHRNLSRGLDAAESLRSAQLEALAVERSGRRTAWRAVALLSRRIPRAATGSGG
jgi:CHAT domain-containing protein